MKKIILSILLLSSVYSILNADINLDKYTIINQNGCLDINKSQIIKNYVFF